MSVAILRCLMGCKSRDSRFNRKGETVMEFLTATFLAFTIIGNLVKVDYIDDETGHRKTESFHRGRYSSRDFQLYAKRKGMLEYEWGDDNKRKIIRLSLEG